MTPRWRFSCWKKSSSLALGSCWWEIWEIGQGYWFFSNFELMSLRNYRLRFTFQTFNQKRSSCSKFFRNFFHLFLCFGVIGQKLPKIGGKIDSPYIKTFKLKVLHNYRPHLPRQSFLRKFVSCAKISKQNVVDLDFASETWGSQKSKNCL